MSTTRWRGRIAAAALATLTTLVGVPALALVPASPASAAVCSDCGGDGEGGGGGGGGTGSVPGFRVVVESLLCHVTEDWTGPDEPYLLGNNVRIWGNGSLNNEQSANVGASFTSAGTASIKLYDADLGAWPDYDDYLGEVVVTADQVGQGRQTADIVGDGATYELTYSAVALP